jgi:hypothetical protein
MSCKQCITDEIWVKFLPQEILNKCTYCNEIGLPITKKLKVAGTTSIIIYIIFFIIPLL